MDKRYYIKMIIIIILFLLFGCKPNMKKDKSAKNEEYGENFTIVSNFNLKLANYLVDISIKIDENDSKEILEIAKLYRRIRSILYLKELNEIILEDLVHIINNFDDLNDLYKIKEIVKQYDRYVIKELKSDATYDEVYRYVVFLAEKLDERKWLINIKPEKTPAEKDEYVKVSKAIIYIDHALMSIDNKEKEEELYKIAYDYDEWLSEVLSSRSKNYLKEFPFK